MTTPGFRQRIENYIATEAKPREKFGHQPRLYSLAVAVGQGSEYDDDVVHAAAWLHDLGVFEGHRPENLQELERWDNTAYVMLQSPRLLSEFEFPQAKIAAVVEAIRTHQPSQTPVTTEGVILRDADILEQLGAVGALRTICKVGRDTRFPTFTAALDALESALTKLPPLLRLATARRLAESRIESMRDFLAAVRIEAGEHLH